MQASLLDIMYTHARAVVPDMSMAAYLTAIPCRKEYMSNIYKYK